MNLSAVEPYALHLLDEHVHSTSHVYPTLAAGVTVTGGAGAWGLGAYAEIVPVNTITERFDIHWMAIEGASAEDVYEIVLYAGTTEIGRARFAVTITAGLHPVMSPIVFQTPIVAANSQIQAKVASSGGGADTVTVSIHYHTY